MSYRTAKIGEAYYDVFTVFDFDLVSVVSGQVLGDFTVAFSKDDAAMAGPDYTITEIGTTGTYAISIPGGFPSTGLWAVTIYVEYNGSRWRSCADVRAHHRAYGQWPGLTQCRCVGSW